MRRIYYEDFVTTVGHKRIYRARNQHTPKPASRAVLADAILGGNYTVHCQSKADILFPRSTEERVLEFISMDSLFTLYCKSLKTGDIVESLIREPGTSYLPPLPTPSAPL